MMTEGSVVGQSERQSGRHPDEPELRVPGIKSPWQLSRALRTARLRRGLTQAQLGYEAGVSIGTVGRAESTGAISTVVLFRLLVAIDHSVALESALPSAIALQHALSDHRSEPTAPET